MTKELIVSALMGMLIFAAALELIPNSYHRLARDAIVECEKTQPRNVHCRKVVAYPQEEK